MWASTHQRAVWFTTMRTSATPRRPSRYASRERAPDGGGLVVTTGASVEAPGEDTRGRHLHDDRVRWADGRLARVLRVLAIQAIPDPTEPWATLDEPRSALHHHALERAPVIGVHVDRHRDARVVAEVLDLPPVVAGGEVDLAAGDDVAHRHQVRHPGGTARRDPADALPRDEIRERLGEAGRRALGHRLSSSRGSRLSQRALPEHVAAEESTHGLQIL